MAKGSVEMDCKGKAEASPQKVEREDTGKDRKDPLVCPKC